jgi:hypothetical protein
MPQIVEKLFKLVEGLLYAADFGPMPRTLRTKRNGECGGALRIVAYSAWRTFGFLRKSRNSNLFVSFHFRFASFSTVSAPIRANPSTMLERVSKAFGQMASAAFASNV